MYVKTAPTPEKSHPSFPAPRLKIQILSSPSFLKIWSEAQSKLNAKKRFVMYGLRTQYLRLNSHPLEFDRLMIKNSYSKWRARNNQFLFLKNLFFYFCEDGTKILVEMIIQPAISCSKLSIETCSKLTIKTPERRHWRRFVVFIVDFEHISHLVHILHLACKCRLEISYHSKLAPKKNTPIPKNYCKSKC